MLNNFSHRWHGFPASLFPPQIWDAPFGGLSLASRSLRAWPVPGKVAGTRAFGPAEPFRVWENVRGALPDRDMIAGDDSLPLFAEYKIDDFLYRRVAALLEE